MHSTVSPSTLAFATTTDKVRVIFSSLRHKIRVNNAILYKKTPADEESDRRKYHNTTRETNYSPFGIINTGTLLCCVTVRAVDPSMV